MAFLAFSTIDLLEAERGVLSTTLLSFSRNLTAYHLFLFSVMSAGSTPSTSATAASNSLEKISLGRSASFFLATLTASSISLSRPVCFNADVSTIGQSRSMERRSMSILIPLLASRSAIFNAITTGIPVSIIWVVRYKLRSMFVASTRFTITSGSSFNR